MSDCSYRWNQQSRTFETVKNPTYSADSTDIEADIVEAGYHIEISSSLEGDVGAEIKVYGRFQEKAGLPLYFIDIMGANTGLATFVADDFLHLLATLKELHPLIGLIGLDQASTVHAVMKVPGQLARP